MEYSSFSALVDHAVAANLKVRAGHAAKACAKTMYPPQYAAEFCTVRVDVGRAVGKSRYIVERCRPWDLVITFSTAAARHLERCMQVRPEARVVSAEMACGVEQYLRGRGHGLSVPRTIWIDEASRIEQRQLGAIYAALGRHPDQTFVLLG